MATSRSFSAMLNQYLPNALLSEELKKRMWLLENVDQDNSWLGGDLIVPFEGAGASSVQLGGLTETTDISEDEFVRGSISTQPEMWGSMLFKHRDLMEHGKISEQNFLKILPGRVEKFIDRIKHMLCLMVTNGPAFASITVDGTAGGVIGVDRPERFQRGQKVYVEDSGTAAAAYYVIAVDINAKTITVSAARGSTAANVSAYSVSQSGKVYFDGAQTAGNRFTSLKTSLLSAANTSGGVSGSSTLYGQTKATYPYLQSIQVDGSGITAANILETIFDGVTKCRIYGKGNANKVLMSFRHLGAVMKLLEAQKGAYHIDQKSTKVSPFGWTEIQVFGVEGQVTLVGIQEMDNDFMVLLDLSALKLYSNGGFRKRQSPDGAEYFEVRTAGANGGYSYVVDVCFFGDLVLERPSYCGIIYGIPSYETT